MMSSYSLDTFLAGHVFAFMLVFARMSGVILLFPGIGEPYVPPRSRLAFAFMLALVIIGPLLPSLPVLPSSSAETARLVLYELIIGLFFGTIVRMINSALEAAGMIVGITTGLSNATIINPALANQSPLPAAFLSVVGMALIFITGLDHFLIRAAIALYDLFPAGGEFMPGDMAQIIMNIANRSFVAGIELAAPFLIMGILLDVAMALMQRLLPQVQVFFAVTVPLQIWGGLILFSLTIAGILSVWLTNFDQSIATFFQR